MHLENDRPAGLESTLQPGFFAPNTPTAALQVRDFASGSIPLSVTPPLRPAGSDAAPIHVSPTLPPPPAVDDLAVANQSNAATAATAELGSDLEVVPDTRRDDSTADTWLHPIQLVHPQIPEKIIRQRKIDQTVVMAARVGADGRVREVHVQHAARDCDECTQNAVAAARGYVYESPGSKVGPNGVWTTIKMRFSTHF